MSNSFSNVKDAATHSGHRARLRDRLITAGGTALADYELVEMLLFASHPRSDTKPLAKQLLAHFGSFAKLMNATHAELQAAGISSAAAASLMVVKAAAEKLLSERVKDKPVVSGMQDIVDLCRLQIGSSSTEQLIVFYLDVKQRVVAQEVQQTGTINHTPLYPREILKQALHVGAVSVIIAHNHPSGEAKPSRDDVLMTQQLKQALLAASITLLDHIIISQKSVYSFKQHKQV